MKRQIILLVVTMISGILLGWVFFHSAPAKTEIGRAHV